MAKNRRQRQKEAILFYMMNGQWISPFDAYILCGTMKLATRISELIADGHNIQKQKVKDREGSYHMEYRLVTDGHTD